jgi:hypothetical protein
MFTFRSQAPSGPRPSKRTLGLLKATTRISGFALDHGLRWLRARTKAALAAAKARGTRLGATRKAVRAAQPHACGAGRVCGQHPPDNSRDRHRSGCRALSGACATVSMKGRSASAFRRRFCRPTRGSKSLEVLIPILYRKGVSTGDFDEALLGNDAGGLSASTVGRSAKI